MARSMRFAAASAMRLLQLASMPPPSIAKRCYVQQHECLGCLLATTHTRWATQPRSGRKRGRGPMGT